MGQINPHPTCAQNMEFILKMHLQTFMHNLVEIHNNDQTKPKKANKPIEIIIRWFFFLNSFVFLFCYFSNFFYAWSYKQC